MQSIFAAKEQQDKKAHKNNSQGTFVLLHWLLENDTISIVSGVSFSVCLAGSLLEQGAGFSIGVRLVPQLKINPFETSTNRGRFNTIYV